MDVLNKIINQNYVISLSDQNIVDIVNFYYEINDFKQKCYYIRTIIESLNNKIIDPDTFLTVAITYCQKPEDVLLIAIALRFGANKNLYLVMNDVGIVHVMVYTVMYLRGKVDNQLIEYILCIESLAGSSSSSYATRKSDNRGRMFDNNLVDNMATDNLSSVGDWLYSQGFYDFTNTREYLIDTFEVEDQIDIGTMLDLPEIAFPMGFAKSLISNYINTDGIIEEVTDEVIPPGPDMSTAILYNAYEVQKRVIVPVTMDKGEVFEVKFCLNVGALEMFKELINRGYRFTYFSMNRLILLLKDTVSNKNGDNVVVNKIFNMIYFEMIKFVISKGVKLDKEQYELLSNFSIKYAIEIGEIYSKPLWIKSCSASDSVPLPEEVKNLSYSANIDITKSKSSVCSAISELTRQNPDTIVEAAISRQRQRMTVDVKSNIDYASGKTEVMCKNFTPANGNPFEYNDTSLAYYTDSHKNTWCFVTSDFENILKNPYNPKTGEKLPAYFTERIQNSLNTFKSVGISPKNITPIGKAIRDFNKPDSITNVSTNFINETIMRLVQIRGIYEERFKEISLENMNYILSIIGMEQDYLIRLSQSHRFATFCKALYVIFKNDPSVANYALSQIKM